MIVFKMYRRNDINNGTLSHQNAMPQKDLTSDGAASFPIGRHVYIETATAANSMTQTQKIAKKWYGNRDSSTVTANRRNRSIGLGSINEADTPLSFTTTVDTNTARQARIRTRNSGYIVPPKCVNSPGSSGVVCYGGLPLSGTKPNVNTNYTETLLNKLNKDCDCNITYSSKKPTITTT